MAHLKRVFDLHRTLNSVRHFNGAALSFCTIDETTQFHRAFKSIDGNLMRFRYGIGYQRSFYLSGYHRVVEYFARRVIVGRAGNLPERQPRDAGCCSYPTCLFIMAGPLKICVRLNFSASGARCLKGEVSADLHDRTWHAN